jgi:uncharacterized protein involved in oxidation of intracellular sulfur
MRGPSLKTTLLKKENTMSEKEEKVLIISTHAKDNPELAAIPFAMANAALAMDVKAVVVFQGEAVYLAKKGYAETLPKPGGFDPLPKLMGDFKELGGEIRVCVPCIKDRNIAESDLIDWAQTIAGGRLITEALKADKVFTY